MRNPRRLVVADVRNAASWYSQALDGIIEAVDDEQARLSLGKEGVALVLERGIPQPHPTTPVLELCVQDLTSWLESALALGATRATPATLQGYAQFRDPSGYLWALRERPVAP
jgi:uncharacterized glyoxalase superfamily protein PhnB